MRGGICRRVEQSFSAVLGGTFWNQHFARVTLHIVFLSAMLHSDHPIDAISHMCCQGDRTVGGESTEEVLSQPRHQATCGSHLHISFLSVAPTARIATTAFGSTGAVSAVGWAMPKQIVALGIPLYADGRKCIHSYTIGIFAKPGVL